MGVAGPNLGPLATGIKGIYAAMATGFVSKTGNPAVPSAVREPAPTKGE